MSPEAQRIAIQEIMWESCGGGCWVNPKHEYSAETIRCMRDWLGDLNAMRDAEEIFKGTPLSVEFVNQLRLIIERTDDLRTVHWFAVVHATAAQRAEAFLRTLGKWRDDK
jgi:hypothetical protein